MLWSIDSRLFSADSFDMHILVLGGGGREHALVKALKSSKKLKQLSCAPGNPGMGQEASCFITDPNDPRKVVELATRIKPDLIVIGPEEPLAKGVSDALRQHQFVVFGPSKAASLLETSKVYSKEFLVRNQIPTAEAIICSSREEVLAAIEKFPSPWVIKADGLAAGKGVRICSTKEELETCLKDFFVLKTLGQATQKVLVERFLEGEEVSAMLLVSGEEYELLPLSQDHKRLNDGNTGPNTGGMGAYAPVKQTAKKIEALKEKIILPILRAFKKEGIDYRGVLYIGLMTKGDDISVIEFNVRFGDPEAQVLLPLLEGDWAQVFLKVAQGSVPKLIWKKQSAVCVVVAAPGYPDSPKKGVRITIDRKISKDSPAQYLLHASTMSHNGYLTNGGRVLNAVGIDKTLGGARKKAYDILKGVEFVDMFFRKDIAEVKKD